MRPRPPDPGHGSARGVGTTGANQIGSGQLHLFKYDPPISSSTPPPCQERGKIAGSGESRPCATGRAANHVLRVIVERTGLGHQGPLYDVTLNGETIVRRHRDPEHAAARALLALGFTGPFETSTMRFRSIEETAKRTVIENAKAGPIVGRYRAFERSEPPR